MILSRINEMHLYVTSKCNLRCVYCSDTDTDASPSENAFMSIEIAKKYVDHIFAHSTRDRMIIVFHGGEPTLQNLEWYHELIDHIEERAHQYEKQYELTMQSNCLHFSDPFMDLIVKKNIQVGTSLDGPPHLNDLTRSNGTKVLANILKLKEAERLGGVISVITKHNCRQVPAMLQFFQVHGLNTVSFNICYSVGGAKLLAPLTADEIFRVFTDTYGYLKSTGGKNVVERFVSIMMKKFTQPPDKAAYLGNYDCYSPFCHAGVCTIICDESGFLYPCGCSDTSQFRLGSIDQVDEDHYVRTLSVLHHKSEKYIDICTGCSASSICSFGCPAFHKKDSITETHLCVATKRFHSFLAGEDIETIQSLVAASTT